MYRPRTENGFILLASLIILSLLTYLTLSSLQSLFLYQKMYNAFVKQQTDFHSLEACGNKLMQSLKNEQENCMINDQDSTALLNHLLQKQGCLFYCDKEPFYYLIEDLGRFSCMQISINKINYSSQHLRINIIAASPSSALLQLRIAKSAKIDTCEQTVSLIKEGLLSWNYKDNRSG